MTEDGALSHLDDAGRPHMVDVSGKAETARVAVARGSVFMSAETLRLAVGGGAKGDVLTTAQIAGIMAAKRTHDLVPLCHPLPLSSIGVSLEPDETRGSVEITATVKTTSQTGVEMEALTAAAVACLTLYDMLKSVDKSMTIEQIMLTEKTGGASGDRNTSDSRAALSPSPHCRSSMYRTIGWRAARPRSNERSPANARRRSSFGSGAAK